MTIESTNVTGLSETCPVPDEQEVLEYASWLTTDILLLVGRFAEPVEAVYLDGAGATRLDVRCLSYSSPDDGREGEAPAEPAKALLLRFPGPVGGPRFEGGLELKVGGASHPLDATELRRVTVDLQSLLREAFAPLPSPARADVVAFLASALEGAAESLRTLQLCGRLFVAREALRERPPWALAGAAGSGGLRVE